jgi:Spy/CpxP family protein refolding chaperone
MKRVLFMLAGVLMFTAVSAQENGQRRERRQRVDRTEQMVKDFKLDAEQAEKVKALNEKYNDLFGMRGFGRGQGGQGGQMQMPSREEMEKMMKERQEKMEVYNTELKEILTAEQFEAYQKQQEQRRRNRPQFGGGAPGGALRQAARAARGVGRFLQLGC